MRLVPEPSDSNPKSNHEKTTAILAPNATVIKLEIAGAPKVAEIPPNPAELTTEDTENTGD